MKKLSVVVLLLSVATLVGCGGGGSGSGGGGNNPPTLQSISVAPSTATINSGATQQFTATGTFSDGTTQNLTGSANWLSSAPAVATINTGGLATGVSGGTTTISASSGGISGSATLTVVALVSITVAPSNATVAPNGTQQFTATGNYSDGSSKSITSSVTWSATAGATITAGGLATGVTPGATSNITATSGSISGIAVLNVTNSLQSITVTPNPVSVAPNATQQFTATGTYADGSQHALPFQTDVPTWSASTGGSITQTGLATAITANTTVTIQAAVGSIAGTAIMNVTNPLTKIDVTPANPQIAAGTNLQFTATGTYADNTTQVLTSTVTWASSNTAVATISNSLGTQGFAKGLATGTATISAASGSVTGSTTLTVSSANLVSIAVTPVAPQIVFQTQQQFTAIGTFSDSTTQDITNSATWASSDSAHITITLSGHATGVATTSSPVTISATQSSVTGSTTATVIPATVTSITITPITTTLASGTSRAYTATATLANGSTLNVTNQATWTSSNPSVATVGLHNGLVKATATGGISVITATYNTVSQNFTLTVNVVTVSSITVTPTSPAIPVGVSQRFNAVAVFSDGSSQDVTQNVTWVSTNTSVATIDSLGVALSASPGVTNVSATLGGQSGNATLNVDTSTLTSIRLFPGQTVLPIGQTIPYNAFGTYSNGQTYTVSGQATWASSDPSVVSIVSGSTAITQSPGAATITATYQGVTSNNGNVIVTSFPLVAMSVTTLIGTTSATVPVGVSTQFQAIGKFSDDSTQALTNYATWAASPSSVATITNPPNFPGLATGISPGTAAVTAVFAGIINNPAATLNVTSATITSIAIIPDNSTVTHGAQIIFKAVGSFSDGSQVDLTNQVNWSSSDVTVATISNTGTCNTASPGTAVITATFDGVSGTANLTVN